MKKFTTLATTAVALTACAQTAPEQKPIGMANPASVFCEQQGGKSVIRKNKDGSKRRVGIYAHADSKLEKAV